MTNVDRDPLFDADDDTLVDFDKARAKRPPKKRGKEAPPWQIYEGSKLPVSKSLGKVWKHKYDAAKATYDLLYDEWDQAYKYYRANNVHAIGETPRGNFQRGDGTENIVYSTVNVLLPAVYGKDPDFTCNTVDKEDEKFCDTMKHVIMAIFKRRDMLNAKQKVRRAVGYAFLTNNGVVKLAYNAKDDSREVAISALEGLSTELEKAKSPEEIKAIYGKIESLEAKMEVSKPSGFEMTNVLPHKHMLDPYAEQPDGLDANWQTEDILLPTYYIQETFTKEGRDSQGRVLVFKPTHKATLDTSKNRDDGFGMVMEAISATETANEPTEFTEPERLAYMHTYYTACVYVWDKITRRVMLFQRDDWTWPLWVWDDPYKMSRFFPYFLFNFGFNVGRTTGMGEVSHILDSQDNINDINRQKNRIRRTVYDYFLYNSNKITPEDAETFIKVLRGETSGGKHALAVALEEGQSIKDAFEAVLPPSAEYEKLFDKSDDYDTVNRMTHTSEALRGGEFRTNTNVPAVETYQEATRLALSAKVDPIEDTLSDLGEAIAEIAVQNLSQDDVAGLVGSGFAANWKEMDVPTFRAIYSLEVVAGSTEKPNSAFKKKEAIQIAQAIGQFAKAAPGAIVKIILRLFQNAFTSINVKPEDWAMIDQEIAATLQKGVSTGAAPGAGDTSAAAGVPGAPPAPGGANIDQMLAQAPPELKAKIAQAAQQGAPPQQIMQMLQQASQQGGGAPQPQPQ